MAGILAGLEPGRILLNTMYYLFGGAVVLASRK